MPSSFLPILTFVAVLLAVVSIYSLLSDLFLRDRSRINQRLEEEFRHKQRDRARKKSSLFKDLNKLAFDGAEDTPSEAMCLREQLNTLLEQSGLELTIRRLISLSVALATCSALLLGALTQSILVGLIASFVASLLPWAYVYRKREQRREAMRPQLSDAFDLMARAMRAGQTMSQSMQSVADEFTAPIAGEFAYCYEQQNLGLSPEAALRDLARRTGLLEINIFVVAVVVQRQVGGNIAEMLEELARLVRERYRTRGLIRTLTAEGRMQAMVLMALPPAMLAAMFLLNRSYAMVLFDRPYLLVGMLVSMTFGALWIRKIITFDF